MNGETEVHKGASATADVHANAHAEVVPPTKKSMGGVAVGVVVLLGGLAVAGIAPRLKAAATEKEDAQKVIDEPAKVQVVHPEKFGNAGDLVLPGSIEPLRDAVVYARTNGYVHKYFVDIGDQVKEGQVLATIDTPEVDQELRQAQASAAQSKAMVVQAKTQRELAQVTVKRYENLAPSGVASQQELDERQAAFDAQQANLEAANAAEGSSQANVHRLADLKNFSQVTAPFDGVITSRTTENGQLVSAGMGSGQALFHVAQLATVRVFLRVPQTFAPSVKVGMPAKVTTRELTGKVFNGTVTRTARSLDPLARTLLTEVDIPNGDGVLLGGMYAQVALDAKKAGQTLIIPSTALQADENGTRVATVVDGKILWKKVSVESDMGDKMSISDGLSESDAVAVMTSAKMIDGLPVVAEAAKPAASGAPAVPAGGAQTAAPAATTGAAGGEGKKP